MGHFAKVIGDKVVRIIVAELDFIDNYNDGLNDGGVWIQTSYNTYAGKHYDPLTNKEDDKPPLRYNYAGIGHTYDKDNDAFIPPKPYDSFVLNTETFRWKPPIPYPEGQEGGTRRFIWDEEYYKEHGKWRDRWERELEYYNPDSKHYDSSLPRDFPEEPWEW